MAPAFHRTRHPGEQAAAGEATAGHRVTHARPLLFTVPAPLGEWLMFLRLSLPQKPLRDSAKLGLPKARCLLCLESK